MGFRTRFWTWANNKREEKLRANIEELRTELLEQLGPIMEISRAKPTREPEEMTIEELEKLHAHLVDNLKQEIGAPDEE